MIWTDSSASSRSSEGASGRRTSLRLRAAACLALAVPLALGLFAACTPEPTTPPDELVHLVVLHTNDIHGQVYPLDDLDRGPGAKQGGFTHIATLIRREKAEARAAGKHVLLLDAGDLFQGTPEGNLTRGHIVVDMMNAVGYDAVAIGNHEYDYGRELPIELSNRMRAAFLGANVHFQSNDRRAAYVEASTQFDVAGVPVRVIGLTTSEMKNVTVEGVTRGLDFEREEETLERVLAEHGLTRRGKAVTIVLSHVGHWREKQLAERFPVLDVIVGGHSHTKVDPAVLHGPGPTLVAQARDKTRYLGKIELVIDPRTRRVVRRSGHLIPVHSEALPPDPEVATIVKRYEPMIGARMNEKLGVAEDWFLKHREPRSTSVGNLVADAMRARAGTPIAFQNRGGVRQILPKGDITMRNLYEISPFGNTIVTMELTGAQILRALEISFGTGGSLLEMSGLRVRYDSRRSTGSRVLSVQVGDRPLDPSRSYKVAVNSYLSRGGDKYRVFREGLRTTDLGVTLRSAMRAMVKAKGRLSPDRTARFKDVSWRSEEGS